MDILKNDSEDELFHRLIGEIHTSTQHGMSEYQIINLMRQVLRDKMGLDRFNAITALGSVDGQKAAADMFESIVDSHLRSAGLRFKTENDLRLMRSRAPTTWKATSSTDTQGRRLFTGPCSLCGKKCECPFKPIVGRDGPQCHDCFQNLTPDFLLEDGVLINGQKVNWIDCKCSYGSASMGIYGKTSLQRVSQDYAMRWGPGAVIFAFGFCEGLTLGNALLLDCTPLDLTKLNDLLNNAPFRLLR